MADSLKYRPPSCCSTSNTATLHTWYIRKPVTCARASVHWLENLEMCLVKCTWYVIWRCSSYGGLVSSLRWFSPFCLVARAFLLVMNVSVFIFRFFTECFPARVFHIIFEQERRVILVSYWSSGEINMSSRWRPWGSFDTTWSKVDTWECCDGLNICDRLN